MNRFLLSLCSILMLAVVVSAVMVSYYAWVHRKLVNDLYVQKIERDELQTVWSKLVLEKSTFISLNRVENIALQNLDMQIPDNKNIKRIAQ